jgi:hypothetical protein
MTVVTGITMGGDTGLAAPVSFFGFFCSLLLRC